MREIKFRAWFDDPDFPHHKSMLLVGDAFGTTHPLDCCVYARQGQPVTLMQYTGLKDRNGKEIYEGDFLVDGGDNVGLVEWVEDEVGFLWVNKYDCCVPGSWGEVIGNIHENPELLEEKDD